MSEATALNVEVRRSALAPVVALVLGIIALVTALDMVFFYSVFPEPERNEDGRLNNQGRSDRRGDIAWGVGLTAAGAGALVWAGPRLARKSAFLEAGPGGMTIDIQTGPPLHLGWHQVASIRSGLSEDETGEGLVLDIELAEGESGPDSPRNARREGRHLLVNADDWRPPLYHVAGRLQVLLERWREGAEP